MAAAHPRHPQPVAAAALLASHASRLRAIGDERARLIQREAEVLRGLAQAGVALPAPECASSGARPQLGALVGRLAAEDAAAHAALETLKRVRGPLARAGSGCARVPAGARRLAHSTLRPPRH